MLVPQILSYKWIEMWTFISWLSSSANIEISFLCKALDELIIPIKHWLLFEVKLFHQSCSWQQPPHCPWRSWGRRRTWPRSRWSRPRWGGRSQWGGPSCLQWGPIGPQWSPACFASIQKSEQIIGFSPLHPFQSGCSVKENVDSLQRSVLNSSTWKIVNICGFKCNLLNLNLLG